MLPDAEIPTVSSRGTPEGIETCIEKVSEALNEVSLNKTEDSSKVKEIDASATTEGIKTNNVSRVVEAVVVVSAIDGIVKEDKRHPKPDAEKKKSSESTKKEATKKIDNKEPKRVEVKEPVKRVDSKESVKKADSKEAVKKVSLFFL